MLLKYIKTAVMTAKNQTNGGLFYLLPDYLIRLVYLLPLMMLWKTLAAGGVDTGMTLRQMLTYTYISNLFGELLNITSPLTHWVMESPLVAICRRPMGVYGQVAAESIGKTLPGLVFFSLPLLLLSPLFGVDAVPASIWVLPSLLLCVSLGFAVEFIFAALLIRMINTSWLVYSIRSAIVWLFSGAMLPFAVLPFGLDKLMVYQPLGSLAAAPLSVYAGTAEPLKTVALQLFWNALLWPVALFVFGRAKERMVSHGG